MKNLIVVIDNEQTHSNLMCTILHNAGLTTFPSTNDESYNIFFGKITTILNSNYAEKDIDELKNYININFGKPDCFVVDVALKDQVPEDKAGINFRQEVIKRIYPEVPVVYVTQYTERQMEPYIKNSKDKYVYKDTLSEQPLENSLKVNLPPVVFEVLENLTKIEITNTSSNTPSLTQQVPDTSQQKSLSERIRIYQLSVNEELSAKIENKKLLLANNKLSEELKKIEFKNVYIHNLINVFFILLLILGMLFLLLFPTLKCYFDLKGETFSEFKVIEYVFIAPLPLIIIFTFYNYYNKILRPIVIDTNEQTDDKKIQSMLDLSITKYLFASVLFSTIAVSLLANFDKIIILKEPNRQSESQINYLKNMNKSDSLIIQRKDSLSPIQNLPNKSEATSSYDLNTKDNMHIYGLATGFLLLVILLFYILKLEKHIIRSHGKNTFTGP